ncbi:MAG: hypothetical protein ACE5JR_08710 [Gemmatimonadota bacterium]
MRKRGRAVAGAAAVLLAASPAPGQHWLELSASRQLDGVSRLEVDVEYAAGELAVFPARAGRLYDYRVRYDASKFRPQREWSLSKGVGRLSVSLDGHDGVELDLDLRHLRGGSHEVGSLSLGLSREVPTYLDLTVGAAESSLELGGVPLTGLRYHTGASETRLRFDEPNPVRMDRLELAVGAASFHAEGLGNARFGSFVFEGGIGDVTLDFSGEWERSATASLDMGVGSLHLRLPRHIGVRIRRSTFLTTFEAGGLEKDGDSYRTANWETAEHRLDIDLDATFGTIEIDFVR